jgi:hypothetical protein
MEEKTVLMHFPVAVNLAVAEPSKANPFGVANQHSKVHAFPAGLNAVPVELADHDYLRRHGVTRHTGPVVEADPNLAERHAEDLRIAEQANADRAAKSLREHAQGNEDRAATVTQRGAEELDRRRLEAGIV